MSNLNSGEAKEKLGNAQKSIEALMKKAMEEALLRIEADAKRNCPVDEGRLRASITHVVEEKQNEVKGRVGTNVEYAPFIEFGTGIYAINGDGRKDPWAFKDREGKFHRTVGTKPRHFMQDAMDKNRDKIAEIFKQVTQEGLKK